MKRFQLPAGFCLIAIAALSLFAPVPARADYSQDQKTACALPLNSGSRAKVIAECSTLLKTPKLPAIVSGPAYLARGNAYATNAADFGKALDDFNSASDILPKDPAPLNSAGIVLLKQRKLMEAFGAFDAANELDGRDPTALYGRGLSRLAMGQGGQKDIDQAMGYDKGIAAFFKANDLYP
jgi:tetratricopeptide (TPR) repeat protein